MADDEAALFALLYSELRAIAQTELRRERQGHTLNATALVNEAFVKLTAAANKESPQAGKIDFALLERKRFLGLAAVAMRRILVDYARMRSRQKRGGAGAAGSAAANPIGSSILPNASVATVAHTDFLRTLAAPESKEPAIDVVELNAALDRLALEHADAARVTELRFFGGLPEQTIAEIMGVTDRTVRRHWTFAKAWLARELENPHDG